MAKPRARIVATEDGHRVTPAELFFDLVFVFAITQVTALLAADPSGLRLLGGMVVLALLWWCWCCFAWLGNVVRADSGAMFAVLVTVMAVLLVVSLTVPEAFSDMPGGLFAPLLLALCYGAVRGLHLVTYWLSSAGDQALRATLLRTALLSVAPPFVLLLASSALHGAAQVLVWLGAVVIDYLAIFVTGASGWRVNSPGHFAERHGLILLIALGESFIAIGVGMTGLPVSAPILAAATAGLAVAAGLWFLYFRQISGPVEQALARAEGDDRTRLARDAYTFLHLPLVAGVVLCALGIKKVLHQVADAGHYELSDPLHGVVAWALAGGVGVFLLAAAGLALRTAGPRPRALVVAGLYCLCAGPLVAVIPALPALALLAAGVTATVWLHGRAARAAGVAPA
ncbi:low temperature requirement protein A [Streptomyces hoynatensis]|uniref:Low temperature requirement protein A n=1 Tax=Streptomyces hoynatensis TaxID=1141874 RepID=A0A3A9ZAM6_9ACTN|nr:low temperature requirement protein A [Streptomyces hoynatensis]RKN45099.1 low temperature requirement protein A [Streptomyces hoynatensis]